jgi:F0F1-type ATP synthase assembly protein I
MSSNPGAAIGQIMAACVIVGLGLGYAAQYFFPNLKPWGMVVGLLLGAVSGIWEMYQLNRELSAEHRAEKRNDKGSN